MAKPGLAIGVTVAKTKPKGGPPGDLGAPSELGGSSMRGMSGAGPRRPGAPPPAAAPDLPPDDEQAEGEEGITLADMGFRDGTEVCSRCQYYDEQSNECMKATSGDRSVGENPDGAGCHAFKPQGGEQEGEPEAEGDEMEGAPAGGPPGRY